MYRLYQNVKGDNGHVAEQIDRNTGVQKSARDLTWSYANILSAMKEREKVTGVFNKKFDESIEWFNPYSITLRNMLRVIINWKLNI